MAVIIFDPSQSAFLLFLLLLLSQLSVSQNEFLAKDIATHSKQINSVAFTSDGKHLFSGSEDGTVTLWSTADWKAQTTFRCDGTPTLSPDHTLVASNGFNKEIALWDITNGSRIWSSGKLIDYRRCISFPSDGRTIAASSFSEIKLFDVATGKELKTLRGHNGWIWSLEYSPDGKHFATGSSDKTGIVWNVSDGVPTVRLFGHHFGIYTLQYSPDGNRIATGSADSTIIIWDASTGTICQLLRGHHGIVSSISFSSDGAYLASGGSDGRIIVWDVHAGNELHSWNAGQGRITSVCFSTEGKWIASSGSSGRIKIWNAQ